MNLNDLHRRLLQDVLEIGNALPLVITGGYAVQAHRLVDRFSRDIDMATDSASTMEAIVDVVVDGLTGRGWTVEVIGVDHHGARMMTTEPSSGEQCELDILRESFSRPPETTPYLTWATLWRREVLQRAELRLCRLQRLKLRTKEPQPRTPASLAQDRADGDSRCICPQVAWVPGTRSGTPRRVSAGPVTKMACRAPNPCMLSLCDAGYGQWAGKRHRGPAAPRRGAAG